MAFFAPLQITLILIATATYILYIKWVRSKYPPGPWPLPIIGNLHLLSKKPYNDMTKMSKTYGPVFTIWIGWDPTIVVSGFHQMKEAAVEKGLDFAGRAMDTVGYRIVSSGNENLATRSYDNKVCVVRKLALSIIKSKAIGGFSIQTVVEEETRHLVETLKGINGKVVDPSNFIDFPAFSIMMRTILNIRFENKDDEHFLLWKKAMDELWLAVEKAMLISLAPALGYIMPGAQNFIRSKVKLIDNLLEKYVQYHEETYQECVIRDLTDQMIKHRRREGHHTPVSERITKLNVCGALKDILSGGTQTIHSTIHWSFLVLLYRADIQEKIHLELDQFLAKRKEDSLQDMNSNNKEHLFSPLLPFTLADKAYLPYLNAFIYETLRLWPAGPLALPHSTMVNTSVGKYSVPKGTAVIFNIYGCHMDETIWDKPLDFIPERFLGVDGQLDNNKVKQLMTFSAGPRNCVGENLAKIELFICLANIFHSFELSCPSVDELPVLNDGHFRLDFAPYPFKMIFKLRKQN